MRDYGNPYITYHLVISNVLPKKGFPVVFHGVKGNEHHAKWSPSYFNIIEASIVRDYCVKLIGDRERKICKNGALFWFYLLLLLFSSAQTQRRLVFLHLTRLRSGPFESY